MIQDKAAKGDIVDYLKREWEEGAAVEGTGVNGKAEQARG